MRLYFSNMWKRVQDEIPDEKTFAKKAQSLFWFLFNNIKIPDIFFKFQNIIRVSWALVITHKDLLHLIIWKFMKHSLLLWLIKNWDVSNLATSLYHLLRFQIWDIFFNLWQKYRVQYEFIADYKGPCKKTHAKRPMQKLLTNISLKKF